MKKPWRLPAIALWAFPALGLLVLIAILLDLALGTVAIPLQDVLMILTGGVPQKATWATIVLEFRLPRAMAATLAGAALAASGLALQALFANPLAGPFALGISSGASLGVALVVLGSGTGGWFAGLTRLAELGSVAAASLGGAAVLVVLLVVARRLRGVATLLLLGLMSGYVTGALVNLLVYRAAPEQVQTYLVWSAGSFGGVSPAQLSVLVPVVGLGLVALVPLARPLNLLLLGEAQAQALGLRAARLRLGIIAATALLAGGVTAFCGPVAFLDIAVPHLCRGILRTADHRLLLPASILMGALLALIADLVCQLAGGGQGVLPLNTVTALIGAPVVVAVILRTRNRSPLD
ncbi:iron ABC transporter permease [Gloeobacter kilaueensis]|uniref:Iron-dicitrate transporter subunit FecD n=1 Tax=Gloeobacter kilaueensis (strain ATCC BAA-2537 / CCAP 1431/1 / ULC 316 / JS1) TaxID=1183438 RepID=U5QBL4_GLOK1|nr:iron ABC transporter permease [Gloeobacter kilaueensis]AGY56287.1 iron-dicitrate transporter subunit FecD [Gloeobacter kilaueensis JS1]